MRKKSVVFILIGCSLLLFLQPLLKKKSFTTVFHATEKPTTIVRGVHGSALTINISFGDEEISNWLETLSEPYPLLLLDPDWAERFPETIQLIKKKNMPTGLLGLEGKMYTEDGRLLLQQIDKYEKLFNEKPLWFRTKDEVFPSFLQPILWEAKINALGSSVTWKGDKIPPMTEGEIIAVPHHLEHRVYLPELKRLTDDREFKSIDEVLFGAAGTLKKIPN